MRAKKHVEFSECGRKFAETGRLEPCAIVRDAETESSEAYDLTGVVETALAGRSCWRRRRSGGTWCCRLATSCGEGESQSFAGYFCEGASGDAASREPLARQLNGTPPADGIRQVWVAAPAT